MKKTKMVQNDKESCGILGFLGCSGDSVLGCLIRKCLDTSITGKLMGLLVVSLVGLVLLVSINTFTLHSIKKLNRNIGTVSIPQYKISQYILRSLNGFKISLIHILEVERIQENNLDIKSNRERLDVLERMILALKNGGSILDVAKISQKTMDVFEVAPAEDEELKSIIDDIIDEFNYLDESFTDLVANKLNNSPAEDIDESADAVLENLNDIHEVVTNLAIKINEKNDNDLSEISRIITRSQYKAVILTLIIVLILIVGSKMYINLIVAPLSSISEKIEHIARGESEVMERIVVRTNDEIGKLAYHLNRLIDNIFSLNTFKAVIEEEESTTEVNQRLAALLTERYHFDKLFIYEASGNKNNMSIAYSSDYEDVCSTEILDDCNFCRAKRTGHPVSSIQYPAICKIFPHGERMEHHCVPMIANGRVVGVIQFLYNKNVPQSELRDFEDRVKRATRYVREATPVLEAKRFASALQESTLKDPMTDLYNRRFLESYTDTLVASTLRRGTRVGVLMCDMDFFKEVNDTHGHETGDIVLIKTAEVLLSCVRASDMVIRYGGEEFLVLLIDVKGRKEIEELAERIRSTMERTVINIPDGALKKTISIGFSDFPADSEGFWEAIKFADIALYQAKDQGRNKVVGFEESMWSEDGY